MTQQHSMRWPQFRATTLVLAGLVMALAAGCAKPPLEEIASAEAALQGAREAQAPEFAPEPYQDAESLMTDTYRLNDNKDYENARGKAVETRNKADEARDLALKARAAGTQKDTTELDAGDPDGEGGRLDVKSGEETRSMIESEEIGAGAMDDGARLSSLEPILFGFDEYVVSAGQMPRVDAVTDWLKENPTATLKIEGHTDERGAADYNMALGSRRANAVKELLVSSGIDSQRIQTVSFGEETPANPGNDEAAWRLNRRAEFVISQ